VAHADGRRHGHLKILKFGLVQFENSHKIINDFSWFGVYETVSK
jgi:hypothetical protein